VAYIALVSWLVTAGLGVSVLTTWLRHRHPRSRFPTRLVAAHVATVTAGLTLWVTYLATGRLLAAWLSFAVVNLSNGLGDTIMLGRFRALAGIGGSWLRDYGRALRAVLTGKYPPQGTMHGILGGITYLATLAACVVGTWGPIR